MNNRLLYLNKKQEHFFSANQPFKMFLGGRGSGKSTQEGIEQYQSMVTMPRSRAFLASSTYASILNVTLPAVTKKWNELGMIEGEDYVVGLKPPRHFEKAFDEPRKYENVVSWANGRRIMLFSMDRPDLNRGGTYTDGALDEAALVSHDVVTKVLIPSIRGYVREYRTHRRGQFRAYTSIPWKPVGYWCLEYEEKARKDPSMYHFTESTAIDNIDILGHDTIRRWQAEMPYLEFLVEVMNQRVRKVQDAFYHTFDPEKHTYTVNYLYGEGLQGITVGGYGDKMYKTDEAFDISFDFSGYFNCASVWQEARIGPGMKKGLYECCLHQFFVKYDEGKISELVDKICTHYSTHKAKFVRLWGEPRGHDPKPDTPLTLFQQIRQRFERNGWRAEIRVKNIAVKSHKDRCNLMADVFAEADDRYPRLRFNDVTCKDMIIAMQVTAVDKDGKKDKAVERDRLYPQEHAPHFTDTVDYYITQKYTNRIVNSRSALRAGVM